MKERVAELRFNESLMAAAFLVNPIPIQPSSLDIHFTVGTSCERAVPLSGKNVAAQHYVLRSLISLHNEHLLYCLDIKNTRHFGG
jgi:hypothetical protein